MQGHIKPAQVGFIPLDLRFDTQSPSRQILQGAGWVGAHWQNFADLSFKGLDMKSDLYREKEEGPCNKL